MRLLFAWTLEIRSNQIDSAAIFFDQLTVNVAIASNAPDEGHRAFKEMTDKYPSVRFESMLLSRDTIERIILQSHFPAVEIQEQLRAHPYFTKPDELPAWLSLWHAVDLPAEAVPLIMHKFDSDFENRRYTDEPQILHIAGLCLWISGLEQPGWEVETVETRIKSYIDDVYDNRLGSANEVRAPRSLDRRVRRLLRPWLSKRERSQVHRNQYISPEEGRRLEKARVATARGRASGSDGPRQRRVSARSLHYGSRTFHLRAAAGAPVHSTARLRYEVLQNRIPMAGKIFF
jgi:hypothetical protein